MRDKDWVHHEGYPRDLGDDEARAHSAGGMLIVTEEQVGGLIDVAHHVMVYNGKIRGCLSTAPACIGSVTRRDRQYGTYTIVLNAYGVSKMAKGEL